MAWTEGRGLASIASSVGLMPARRRLELLDDVLRWGADGVSVGVPIGERPGVRFVGSTEWRSAAAGRYHHARGRGGIIEEEPSPRGGQGTSQGKGSRKLKTKRTETEREGREDEG